jgi:hypothetical protein
VSCGDRSSVRGAAASCWGPRRMESRRGPFAVSVRKVSASGIVILGSSAGDLPPSVSTPRCTPAPTGTRRWGTFSCLGEGPRVRLHPANIPHEVWPTLP